MIQVADRSLSKTQQSTSQSNKRSIDFVFLVAVNSQCARKIGHWGLWGGFMRQRWRSLKIVARHLKPHQRAFIGVIDVNNPHIETPDEVCARVMEAARYIAPAQLGTTDDCGFSPFCDDDSTPREVAFAKIRARVQGTALASRLLSQ
jgi:methionine synthase II (cobalamin-independent)